MTDISERSKAQEASYQLSYEPDGTSFTVRENLVDILERELLGPINGPDELLPFSPRSQYLIGHIAPVRLMGIGPDRAEPDGVTERGDLIEPRPDGEAVTEVRGVPAFAVDEHEADSDEDDAEDRAPKQGLMIPASMGLRFQVPLDLEAFTVIASWGTYETVQTDKVTKAGRPIRHFQRVPIEESRTIRLAELKTGQITTIPLRDTICPQRIVPGRGVRQAIAWEIGRDHRVGARQAGDQVPPGATRAAQTMDEQHCGPGSGLRVGDRATGQGHPTFHHRCRRRFPGGNPRGRVLGVLRDSLMGTRMHRELPRGGATEAPGRERSLSRCRRRDRVLDPVCSRGFRVVAGRRCFGGS